MPSKYYQRNFVAGNYYHIYNRGSHKHKTFSRSQDYKTFISILQYYLRFPTGLPLSHVCLRKKYKVPNLIEKPVTLTAYCLMPNHYHLLLKQHADPTPKTSITNFMRRLSITYAMYFNDAHNHSGNIFQGKYKQILVKTEPQLLHLTRYIHRNPTDIKGSEPVKLFDYPFSSYPDYLNPNPNNWVQTNDILHYFSTTNPNLTYQRFVEDYQEYPESLQKLTLEVN